jgi:voltage-gated potassium channel
MIDLRRWSRKWSVALPLPILLAGTVGFHYIEGWSWIDCFYMTVTTVSTVGYGWITEPGDDGKLFASALILLGVGTFSFMITLGIQGLLEKATNQDSAAARRARKMRDHYIVCGAGRVGKEISHSLQAMGKPFILIEQTPTVIEELRAEGLPYLAGDATLENVLSEAGVKYAKGIACVLTSDADNVFTCLVAREMNPDLFIVARSSSSTSISKLLKAGANKVINPFTTTAYRMAQTLIRPTVVNFLEVASNEKILDLHIEEIVIPKGSVLDGKRLDQSEIRQRENVIIAAIQKTTGRMIFNPLPAEVISDGDVLIAMGSKESLSALVVRANP